MVRVLEESRQNRNHEAIRSTQKVQIAVHRQCWRKADTKTTHQHPLKLVIVIHER